MVEQCVIIMCGGSLYYCVCIIEGTLEGREACKEAR